MSICQKATDEGLESMINGAATLSNDSSDRVKRRPLRWEPKTKAQARALNSQAEILLFGGAAGSLKTETLLIDAVREADNPNLNSIIFRESYPQLADIIRKSRRLLTGRPYWGKYNAGEHIWTFPRNLREMRTVARSNDERYAMGEPLLAIPEPVYDRGATLKLGYLRSDDDCADHDGQEYSFVAFDESTHHTEYQIRYLLSRLRSTDPPLCFAACDWPRTLGMSVTVGTWACLSGMSVRTANQTPKG